MRFAASGRGGWLLAGLVTALLLPTSEAFFKLRNFGFFGGNSSTTTGALLWPSSTTSTASSGSTTAKCKTVTPPTDIDLTAYAAKPWFIHQQMVSESGNPGNRWNSCVRAVYTIKDTRNVGVYNRAVEGGVNGTLHEANLCAVVSDRKKPGELKVGPCFIPTAFYGPYWVVIYNEKEGYAMVSGGQPYITKANGLCATGNGVNKSGLWLFSRSAVRDEALIKKVRDMAVNLGIDVSGLNDVNHVGCRYS